VLATGPTGSGKTTTLYTMLEILNRPEVNISTVEDPIEYQMPRVNQTQVKSEIGLTFANGLRSLLRQDPDIVMVGEIRDGETASLAINASLTGHLVLSTIHTNSAAGAIPRLIDMGALPFLIVSTVKTIIAQRLVRRLVESKEKYFLSSAEIKNLEKIVDLDRMLELLKLEKIIDPKATWDKIPFYKPKPSKDAPDGYMSRIGLHEVLKVTASIKEMIIKGSSQDEMEAQAKSEGMMTILEDGVFQAVLGTTSLEEVFRVVSESLTTQPEGLFKTRSSSFSKIIWGGMSTNYDSFLASHLTHSVASGLIIRRSVLIIWPQRSQTPYCPSFTLARALLV